MAVVRAHFALKATVLSYLCLALATGRRHAAWGTSVTRAASSRDKWGSCWSGYLLGWFVDVDVVCGFPPEEQIFAAIREREEEIVQIDSETYITPDMQELDVLEMPDGVTSEQVLQDGIQSLLTKHADTCAGNTAAAATGSEVYDNLKSYVESFDVYSKCTKAYVPNQVEGKPRIRKDDVIVIVTKIIPGHFTISYEDVTEYSEYVDEHGTKTLQAVVSSRKENVIEGNYAVIVQLFANQTVRLAYTKRQNLAEGLMKKGVTHAEYIRKTQSSVDQTILKLAYAGRYGPSALDDSSGCFQRASCTDWETIPSGERCSKDEQCISLKCEKVSAWCFNDCEKVCA